MQGMHKILSFKRKSDNLFLCLAQDYEGAKHRIYCDMTRSQSGMFMHDEEVLGSREFNAPFDMKLLEFSSGAEIKQVRVDGSNRILQIFCVQRESYKQRGFWLMLEFTGKHTNVILCDEKQIVIEALHHIPLSKSWREVRVGKTLEPLPQPIKAFVQDSVRIEDVPKALREAYTQRYESKREQKKAQLLRALELKRDGLRKILQALPQSDELIESARQYAKNGELLFASLHLLPTQKIIDSNLRLVDFDGQEVVLELPACAVDLPSAGNWYFAQSKKLQKKAQHLYKQIENLQDKIEFLSDEIMLLQQCEGLSEILATQGQEHKIREQKDRTCKGRDQKVGRKKSESNMPHRDIESFFIEGIKIGIGRNVKDNQRLLEIAKADDLWMHIRDVPSAHLIIFCGKKTPSLAVIEKSGEMLVRLYAARYGGGDFVVDYTQRRFVKASSNAQVLYAKHKSLGYRI